MNRRSFLQTSLAASAALSLPARVRAAADGANGDIRVAVVGFHGRGEAHISGYLGMKDKGVRIVALCDVDTAVLDKGVAQLKAKGQEVTPYQDIRKLLENKDIDAISIATPNHWHALAGIWSLQAGKDLYVEKPISHNVWEGRQLVKATDSLNRIVQMGVQSRSGAGIAAALEWVKSEPLGKLQYVRGLCYKRRASIGKVEGEQPIPATIDYDLWCGPAEKLPLHRQKLHYDWHWVWNTGNGDLGNQGIHQMDIARRFTGEALIAPATFSVGGRLGYVDDGETPNSMFIYHDYAKAPLIFEVRGLPSGADAEHKAMDEYRGSSIGVIVQYENGYIVCPDYNNAYAVDKDNKLVMKFGKPPILKDIVDPEGASASASEKKEKTKGDPDHENHFANFIKAVRSRNKAELHAPILEGHISSALCHTGNISYRLGSKLAPGAIREKIKGNKEAMDSFERLATHLAANNVDITNDQLTFGEFLKFDPVAEKFIDNKDADKLLTREYRAPFVVLEKV
jgi:predicted dehydrogenase